MTSQAAIDWESAVLSSRPDERIQIFAPPEYASGEQFSGEITLQAVVPFDVFFSQWEFAHVMGGHLATQRIKAPVDLQSVATSPSGEQTCRTLYEILDRHETTRRLFLSPEMSIIGQAGLILMHGFTCVQVIKAAAAVAAAEAASKPGEKIDIGETDDGR